MKTEDLTIKLILDKSPSEVFKAVNDVRGWWSGEIEGDTNKLDGEFTYQVGDVHFSKQKIVGLVPNKRVVWLITDSKLNFLEDKSEWTNTKISFDIEQKGDKTELTFTHWGLVPKIECFSACSDGWDQLIHKSLFSLITTGKGKKIF